MYKWHFIGHLGGEWRKICPNITGNLLGELMQVHLVPGWYSDREARGKHQSRNAVGGAPSI